MLQKNLYNSLNEKEKYYFQQIEYYSAEIPAMSITDLSEKIYTSPASLSRLVKKLGYDSFKDFKMSFATKNIQQYNGTLRTHMNQILDTYPYIIDNCVIDLVKDAKKIYIIAFGNTSGIGHELGVTMMKLGYIVHRVFDSDFMYDIKHNINNDDLLIYISHDGMDVDMQMYALHFKNTNKQLLITSNSNSKLASHVSLIINSHTNEYNLPFKTRLPLELIITIICMRLHDLEC